MQRLHGKFHILAVDQNRDLDLRSADHLDVHIFSRQSGEHLGGHPDLAAHANADDRNLGHIRVGYQLAIGEFASALGFFHGLARALHLIGRQAEGHVSIGALVGGVVQLRDVLDDHVHIHTGFGQGAEDGRGDAGAVFNLDQRHLRLVAAVGDARNNFRFHDFVLVADQSSRSLIRILE